MDIVECGKLVAFCKVFQHHSSTFPIILHHSLLSLIILQHSSSFHIILPFSPTYLILRHTSTSFDKSTLFFYNIFRQHFFSTTFDIILQNHFSTRNFCHLLSNKKLVVCCIINMILSVCYYQLNIINMLLSLSYYQLVIIIMLLSLS